MSITPNFIVYDPVSFAGGSKIAMAHIISACQAKRPIIVTCDPKIWNQEHHIIRLYLPNILKQASSGGRYYCKQMLLMLQLFIIVLRYYNVNKIAVISGPAVDIAALVLAKIFNKHSIQLIQGPVSCSRIAIIGLKLCSQLFYLSGCEKNLSNIMANEQAKTLSLFNQKCTSFINGLPIDQWPSSTDFNASLNAHPTSHPNPTPNSPKVFWAASLLKWKGLNILEQALKEHLNNTPIQASICYIKPKNTALACYSAPKSDGNMTVWQAPKNLDDIRKQCNIFVSTSQKEPFGLSILEAMAAGLCPIIPRDGAYWDTQLTHGINCLKYTPNNAQSLAHFLALLNKHPFCISLIGQQAQDTASHYQAHKSYRAIVQALMGSAHTTANRSQLNSPHQESSNA